MKRITKHPILDIENKKEISFYFEGKKLKAYEGEMLSSALFANGERIFSIHKKDNSPQGIFCANGQCAQCSVVVDNKVVKSCITQVKENMKVEKLNKVANLTFNQQKNLNFERIEEIETDVLIVGGGPSGMSCASELGKFNLDVLLIDDKDKLGGKLVLQTHKFFGSVQDCYAGTRGIDIADKLSFDLEQYPSVKVKTKTTCLAVFSDKKVGLLSEGIYYIVKPKVLIVASGAREKNLIFSGNSLPGIYGAGAFQTLVNRDLIKASEKLFIVGGGNVGLIAAYHALQAGIKVLGLAEAAPNCGGYKVHLDKIKRLGVPIYTSHTILKAEGKKELESIIISKVDENFKPIKGTEKKFNVDTLLIAVGLNSVDEFYKQAKDASMNVFSCGDAAEIAEASAAIFSGKITAHNVLKSLGFITGEVPSFWLEKLEVLKSRPGKTYNQEKKLDSKNKIQPIIHCKQEIPCNPCVTVCPKKSIKLSGETIMSLPNFEGDCIGCFKCLLVCPGLAINLVDMRKDEENPIVYFPYENDINKIKLNEKVLLTSEEGEELFLREVVDIKEFKNERTFAIGVKMKKDEVQKVASFKILKEEKFEEVNIDFKNMDDDTIICRCERVSLGEIRKYIREGIKDLNQIKALTRAGMGACGGKTCNSLLISIMKSEGVNDFTDLTKRPLFVEAEFKSFAGLTKKEGKDKTEFSNF